MKYKKIVINTCFGGFSLSEQAYQEMNIKWDGYGYDFDEPEKRTNRKLIACIEKLREKANGRFADLRVIKIPYNHEFYIYDYDGVEKVYSAEQLFINGIKLEGE